MGNIVEASPTAVMSAIKQMTVLQFLRRFNDRKELNYVLSERAIQVSKNELRLEVRYAGDHILTISAKVTPLDAGHTAYEIAADLPPSRLTVSDKLFPKDVANAEAAIALVATDYVAQSFGFRPDQGPDTEERLKTALGLSDVEVRALSERFMAALGETYGPEVMEASYRAEKDEQAEYETERGLGSGEAPPAWRAEEAARRAMEDADAAIDQQ